MDSAFSYEKFLVKWEYFIQSHCPQGNSILRDIELMVKSQKSEEGNRDFRT